MQSHRAWNMTKGIRKYLDSHFSEWSIRWQVCVCVPTCIFFIEKFLFFSMSRLNNMSVPCSPRHHSLEENYTIITGRKKKWMCVYLLLDGGVLLFHVPLILGCIHHQLIQLEHTKPPVSQTHQTIVRTHQTMWSYPHTNAPNHVILSTYERAKPCDSILIRMCQTPWVDSTCTHTLTK